MDTNNNSSYDKQEKYTITYKDLYGKMRIADLTAANKLDAENRFKEVFCKGCSVIKTQTTEEWMKEMHKKITEKNKDLTRKIV